ncbi:bifunctional alpha,alpha-trehalose-phosphate synthase (UDP-forming)/trehalose-phosphatase [Sporocytophaga myxococcoides]|uniref:bifunctional alpha,alpha-trehalose-phosphate synthase (UDP-forming)/trehalose-phosphatase n=1 Tax=Sporocytophaga myxococcoides TaxID=153721 RepID=UPI000405C77D|nr:bifunctional alpha,alpha-trehalose-phosphate synthase (UDP-forming)/trehalose-phosphatase [Sporocytophaga myxococcoides]
MEKTIIVSNRLPVTLSRKDNKVVFTPSPGGLATGLAGASKDMNSVWIGWAGFSLEGFHENTDEIKLNLEKQRLIPIFLEDPDVNQFYEGFSNTTLWPLFHSFPTYTSCHEEQWEVYKKVNEIFCEEVLRHAGEEDLIWIHDYHLLLLPGLIRKKLPKAKIAYFQHIPFPSYEIFRILPWREQILEGVTGADLIGFHTHDDVKHFLTSIQRILGMENKMGTVRAEERIFKVDAFPLGIDFFKYWETSKLKSTERQVGLHRKQFQDVKIILSIDRLDYTKGIPERLKAFDVFLEKNPEFREKVSLLMIVVPSREKVQLYKDLKMEIDEMVGNITSKYRTVNWTPVLYFYRSYPLQSLSAFYKLSDVALITPLRDGMNLVCKEYVASRNDETGVLILSEMAGAAKELSDALIINPYNIEECANAIKNALCMPFDEQQRRMSEMQYLLRKYDVSKWTSIFLKSVEEIVQKQQELAMKRLTPELKHKVISDFNSSKNRIVFLDYDGTLVSFQNKPEHAKPDENLIDIMTRLCAIKDLKVVIISGRNKETLNEWFGHFNMDIIAEHGLWMRRDKNWKMMFQLNDEWKKELSALLNHFVEKTPGTFIEEKDHSLVWHYRKADDDLSNARKKELLDYLQYLTTNMGLSVLEGNKVVEIKSALINKGRAVKKYLKAPFDFILAAGDDWTDEDMFKEMPEHAYTIKIGSSLSAAKYTLPHYIQGVNSGIRTILSEITEKTQKLF